MNKLQAWWAVSLLAGCAQTPARIENNPPMAASLRAPAPGAGRTLVDVQRALGRAYSAAREVTEGKNADYIPELAKVDSNLFGIVLMRVDGERFEIGDTQQPFSIQSIVKVFTAARALTDSGPEKLLKLIGANATGQPFNSVLAVAVNKMQKRPLPGNPMVNAGAMAAVDLVAGRGDERWKHILGNLNAFAGRALTVDEKVYKSESDTNANNKGILWLLKAAETVEGDPDELLDLYTRECSVAVTARDLAAMGATLASGGVNPLTGERVLAPEHAAEVLALMATAGLYEDSGAWLFRVGVPAKSGVGGGILAVVPGRFAIAAFSPPLDEAGNSVRAQRAISQLVNELGGNLFVPRPAPSRATADAEP
jgi:glutaminase